MACGLVSISTVTPWSSVPSAARPPSSPWRETLTVHLPCPAASRICRAAKEWPMPSRVSAPYMAAAARAEISDSDTDTAPGRRSGWRGLPRRGHGPLPPRLQSHTATVPLEGRVRKARLPANAELIAVARPAGEDIQIYSGSPIVLTTVARPTKTSVLPSLPWRAFSKKSNPHDQLGKLLTYPGRPIQLAALTRKYDSSIPLCCLFG